MYGFFIFPACIRHELRVVLVARRWGAAEQPARALCWCCSEKLVCNNSPIANGFTQSTAKQ